MKTIHLLKKKTDNFNKFNIITTKPAIPAPGDAHVAFHTVYVILRVCNF